MMKTKKLAGIFLLLMLAFCCVPARTALADMGSPDLSTEQFYCYLSGWEDNWTTNEELGENGAFFRATLSGLDDSYSLEYDEEKEQYCPHYTHGNGIVTNMKVWENYTGKAIKPGVTLHWVKSNGTIYKLTEGTDYTVSYSNNVKPGKATLTITGKGEISGSKTIPYYIKGQVPTIKSVKNTSSGVKITWKKCSCVKRYLIYTVCKGIDDDYNTQYIGKTTGTSYTIPVKSIDFSNYGFGDYKLCVKADYAGGDLPDTSCQKEFYYLSRLAIKTMKSTSKGKVKLTWKKSKEIKGYSVCGYQVEISRTSSFSKYKLYKIKGYKNTTKTLSSLKSKKKYYVRLRAYITSPTGKNFYSTWSAKKSIYVK